MRPARTRDREESGSITPFVVIVSLAILMLAALVVDGGRQLNAKGRAIAYAQEAARAGSQAIDVADPRLDLVPRLALRAARTYCAQAMAADHQLDTCRPTLSTVHDPAGAFTAVAVKTHVRIDAILLGIVNKSVLGASGTALARPVSGISKADSGKVATVAPPSVAPPASDDAPPATAPPTPPEVDVTPCVPKPKPTPRPRPSDGTTPKPTPKPSRTPHQPTCKTPGPGGG